MKDNKVTRIILIAAVVLVWGLIMIRVIGRFSSNDVPLVNNVSYTFEDNKQMTDTFDLLLDYNDPFLGYERIVPPLTNKQTNVTLVNAKVEKKTTQNKPFPRVIYYGLIINKETQKLVAIININGSQILVQQGNEILGVRLLKIENDSILIDYENEKKWICK